MPLKITPRAIEVLERAVAAAVRFNPDASVRVFRVGDRVDTAFADSPQPDDEVLELEDFKVYVESGIGGVLDVTDEHDRFVVR